MKYCTKCGKEIKEGAKFCDSCGEAITKDKKIETKPKDKKNNKKIIIIGTIILFVIIIGVIILSNIIYNSKKEEDYKKTEDYEKFEKQLEVAGENYIKLKGYELDKESSIIIKDIEKENLINNDLVNKCDGYVLIEKDEDEDGDYDYDYDAYIKCGNKYKTKGYNHTYSKKSNIVLKVKESKEEIKDEEINYEYKTNYHGLKLIYNKELMKYNYADEDGKPVFYHYYTNSNNIYKYDNKIFAYTGMNNNNEYEVYDLNEKTVITKVMDYNIYEMIDNYILSYDNDNKKVILLFNNNVVIKEIPYEQKEIGIQQIYFKKYDKDNNFLSKGIYIMLYNTNKQPSGCDVYQVEGRNVKLIDSDYCGY